MVEGCEVSAFTLSRYSKGTLASCSSPHKALTTVKEATKVSLGMQQTTGNIEGRIGSSGPRGRRLLRGEIGEGVHVFHKLMMMHRQH